MSDRALSVIREDLETIRRTATAALEMLATLGAGFAPAADVPRGTPETRVDSARQVRELLPYDLLPKLTVVAQVDGLVTITAPWLTAPSFDQVTQAVKKMGGRWIKAGKASRWEVPIP